MDKKNFLALALIAVIIVTYPLYMQWVTGKKAKTAVPKQETVETDTSGTKTITSPSVLSIDSRPSSTDTAIQEKIVKVETDLYKAEFSTKSAVLTSFIVKKYKYSGSDKAIELVLPDGPGALEVLLGDSLVVQFKTDLDGLVLSSVTDTGTVTFIGTTADGATIVKRYTFYNEEYHFGLKVELSGILGSELKKNYTLAWSSGLAPTEKELREDLQYFEAYSMMGKELRGTKKFKKENNSGIEILEESNSGQTEWVATKTKYFLACLVPLSQRGSGFSAYGQRWFTQTGQQKVEHKKIGVALEMPITNQGVVKDSFMVYLGPLDYLKLKHYRMGLENTVDLGWKIIKPFSIAILWIFVNLHRFIPNYGVVIIIFTFLMKIVLHPLTFKSTKSMSKMQQIQPKVTELREKHKDDPQRMNQEMMKLYKQQGVNPFGGCLPLLLQMPLFYGLFVIFRSTIELRGAEFAWWLKDLSQKDPYYILPLIMSAAMFWQQKMTIKDPKQKAMVYLMPILFFFLFKGFPAGLTLYWTLYNILSLVEQYYLKDKSTTEVVAQ